MLTKKLLSTLLLTTLSTTLMVSAQTSQPVTSITQQKNNAELIPVSLFFNEDDVSNIQLSPDGQWVAFFKELDGARNIFLVSHDKKLSDAFPLTHSKDPINNFVWAESGNKIFFAYDEGGNENTQISSLVFKNNNPDKNITLIPLTNNSDIKYQFVKQIKKTPNKLVVKSNHDNPEQVDIFHLNIDSKKLVKITDNTFGFNHFKSDSSGNPVIAVSSNKDNSETLYIKNESWEPVFTTAFGEGIKLLSFDETKRIAYITADIQDRDKAELLSFDLTDKTFTSIHRDPENQSDVYDVEFNSKGQPVAVSYYGGRLRTYSLNTDFSQHWNIINEYFTDDVEIDINTINEKTKQWQLTVASDVTENISYSYNAATKRLQALLPITPTIKPEALAKRQSITYQARDGITIQAYLTLPKGGGNNLPTIILPHGGPWERDYWTLSGNSLAQLLANRGYVVLQPNFRASTGFGKKFMNLGNKNWGTGSMQHDLTDGVNYLIEQGIADKNRVGIMGASYGGYAALAGITFTPDVYKASVSYVGPSSLITLVESFPSYFRPYLGQFFSAIGDPLIEADREDMNARSPLNFVDKIKAPLLIIQGANDPRVTQIESDNIAKKMSKKGLPVEYILAKDEGHGFRKRENSLASFTAIEQFFAKHLSGQVDINTPKEIQEHLNTLIVDTNKL